MAATLEASPDRSSEPSSIGTVDASTPEKPLETQGSASSVETKDLPALQKLNAYEEILAKVGHRGSPFLFARSLTSMGDCVLSIILAAADENTPHTLTNGICQFINTVTLLVQFKTANPYMFIIRGLVNWVRVAIYLHNAICGRNWPGEGCSDDHWGDMRAPFHVLAIILALLYFLNGCSLFVQFMKPRMGVGQHGNHQLFVRGYVQAGTMLIHYIFAMLKMAELSGSSWERGTIEIVVHFLRCFVTIPIAVWSLFDQWVTTGTGKKTDDWRTSGQGEPHPNAADKLTKKIAPHKGHRNLLIRATVAMAQAVTTAWCLAYDIAVPAQAFYIVTQLVSSASLFFQWRTGNPKMFLVRGSANWVACLVSIHVTYCGTVWPGETCSQKAYEDERFPMRVLGWLATARVFFNGMSLMCQYKFPHRMIGGHGNEQLFFRGCIQATGVPINIARFCMKVFAFDDSIHGASYVPLEYTINLLRGAVMIPISSWSLFHQWKHTSAGNTGHPRSDLFERESDPTLVNPNERLKITIISAKGLRRADLGGKSDPYCSCMVGGRPETEFQTEVINKTLEPVWNASQELSTYRRLDLLEFVVRDHDEAATSKCCKFFDDGDDLLGKAVLTSEQIHSGFEGELRLTHAGRHHKHAVINLKIEILAEDAPATEAVATEVEEPGILETLNIDL